MNLNIFNFIFCSHSVFDDFRIVYEATLPASPYVTHISQYNYFAPTYQLAFFLSYLPKKVGLYLFLTGFVVVFLNLCKRYLTQSSYLKTLKNILIFSFLSYPFLFALSRANYECLLFVLISFFSIFYPDLRKSKIAGLLLALSIAMKLFPAVFLVLYISDKRYKEAITIILTSLVIGLVSYALLENGLIINIHDHLINLSLYNNDYAIGNGGLAFGHSLFGLLKFLIAKFSPLSYINITIYLFKIYPFIAFLIFIFVTVYLQKIETVFWKKIALLVMCMDLLPHVSADYKLLYFFIPTFLFIEAKDSSCFDVYYAIIFALLLTFKSFWYYQFLPATFIVPFAVNTSVFLNPIIMLVAIGLILYQGLFRQKKASDSTRQRL